MLPCSARGQSAGQGHPLMLGGGGVRQALGGVLVAREASGLIASAGHLARQGSTVAAAAAAATVLGTQVCGRMDVCAIWAYRALAALNECERADYGVAAVSVRTLGPASSSPAVWGSGRACSTRREQSSWEQGSWGQSDRRAWAGRGTTWGRRGSSGSPRSRWGQVQPCSHLGAKAGVKPLGSETAKPRACM